MSSLFSAEARTQIVDAVREAESLTAAEFVVVLRREADPHWGAAALTGFVTSAATLMVLLFAETEFATHFIPLDLAIAFVAGVVLFRLVPFAPRFLLFPSRRRSAAERAAKAAFYDLGISKTRDRTGVLLYLAMAERVAVILEDVGLDTKRTGPAWASAVAIAEVGVDTNDSASVAKAVIEMGKSLSTLYPRKDDDENELPDEMVA